MGTTYELFNDGGQGIEVEESSCKFEISMWCGSLEPEGFDVGRLTLEELKEINQKLTNVISYF